MMENNTNKEIKVGTIVELKSGGPRMIINKTYETGEPKYECVWFNTVGQLCTSFFGSKTITVIQ